MTLDGSAKHTRRTGNRQSVILANFSSKHISKLRCSRVTSQEAADKDVPGEVFMTVNTSCDGTPTLLGENEWELRVYSSLQCIAALSRQWEELLAIAPCNRAFASREWYAASSSKQSSWSPLLVAAFYGKTIMGILPLVIDHEDNTVKFPHHAADYNDAIVRNADPNLAAELLSYAFAASRGCRRMVLSKLRPDCSSLLRALGFPMRLARNRLLSLCQPPTKL
jgi:hypothetical protein